MCGHLHSAYGTGIVVLRKGGREERREGGREEGKEREVEVGRVRKERLSCLDAIEASHRVPQESCSTI